MCTKMSSTFCNSHLLRPAGQPETQSFPRPDRTGLKPVRGWGHKIYYLSVWSGSGQKITEHSGLGFLKPCPAGLYSLVMILHFQRPAYHELVSRRSSSTLLQLMRATTKACALHTRGCYVCSRGQRN